MKIISVREQPEYLERAVGYFAEKFGVERRIYDDCISYSITTDSSLPRWYLLLKKDRIIGCCGIIINDLYPWLAALYVEADERGQRLGSVLIEHALEQTGKLGFKKLYLATDHTGYYEEYGWTYLAQGYHPWENGESRIYEQQVSATETGSGKGS